MAGLHSSQQRRRLRLSPDASRPLSPADLLELRRLKRELVRLLERAAPLGHHLPAAEVARRLGFQSVRTVREIHAAGLFFRGAWKPAPNRLHIPVADVEEYLEAHRLQSPGAGADAGTDSEGAG